MNTKKTGADTKTQTEAALKKKAFGYDFNEVVDEYSFDDGEPKLIRRKQTLKNVPPDVAALKLLIEQQEKAQESYYDMSDTELLAECVRLYKLLKIS